MNENISKNNKIRSLIYEIRGRQVMLDSDLAGLYQCKNGTKEINQAVRNNPKKFPERFSWVLTDSEYSDLRSKILTSNAVNVHGGRRYNPRVFTEQGVAMLATILKSEVAILVSIQIMDAFITMRHYIGGNISRLSNLESKVLEHDKDIKLLQSSFDEFRLNHKSHEIYFNGQIYDAYSKILEIFKESKNELVIIDAYADKTTLDIIKDLEKIKVTIITNYTNRYLTKQLLNKYKEQYSNLEIRRNNNFHDRYFIIDKKTVYHCGASINRIGYKTFSISRIQDNKICKLLIDEIDRII